MTAKSSCSEEITQLSDAFHVENKNNTLCLENALHGTQGSQKTKQWINMRHTIRIISIESSTLKAVMKGWVREAIWTDWCSSRARGRLQRRLPKVWCLVLKGYLEKFGIRWSEVTRGHVEMEQVVMEAGGLVRESSVGAEKDFVWQKTSAASGGRGWCVHGGWNKRAADSRSLFRTWDGKQ